MNLYKNTNKKYKIIINKNNIMYIHIIIFKKLLNYNKVYKKIYKLI